MNRAATRRSPGVRSAAPGRSSARAESGTSADAIGDVGAAPAVLVGQAVVTRVVLEQRARGGRAPCSASR